MREMTDNQNGNELKSIAIPDAIKKKLDEHKENEWEPYHSVITRLMRFYDEHKKEEASA